MYGALLKRCVFGPKIAPRSSGGGAPEAMASKLQLLQRDLKIVKEGTCHKTNTNQT